MPDKIAPTPSRRRVFAAAGAAGLAMSGLTGTALAQAIAPAVGRFGAQPDPDAFTPLLHKDFVVWNGEARTLLRLVEVRRYARGRRPAHLPQPYSLFFQGWPSRPLASESYEVQAPDGTRSRMFLTPVAGRSLYEAPFN